MKLFWNMGQCLNEANLGEESKDGVLGLMSRENKKKRERENKGKEKKKERRNGKTLKALSSFNNFN